MEEFRRGWTAEIKHHRTICLHGCCCLIHLPPWLCPLPKDELVSEIQCRLLNNYLGLSLDHVSLQVFLFWPAPLTIWCLLLWLLLPMQLLAFLFSPPYFLMWVILEAWIQSDPEKLWETTISDTLPGSLPGDCPACLSLGNSTSVSLSEAFLKIHSLELQPQRFCIAWSGLLPRNLHFATLNGSMIQWPCFNKFPPSFCIYFSTLNKEKGRRDSGNAKWSFGFNGRGFA